MDSQQILNVVVTQLRTQGLDASLNVDETRGTLRLGGVEVSIERRGLSVAGTADNLLLRALVAAASQGGNSALNSHNSELAETDNLRIG